MLNRRNLARESLAGVALTLTMFTAPAVHADIVPDPEPVPEPTPGVETVMGAGECEAHEVPDPNTGTCIPAMGAVQSTAGGETLEEPMPRTTQDITSSSTSGVGANLVPNINGDPCTGYWQSVACYEMEQDNVAVQPRSTLSSSP